jgi:hypothetical protein
VEESARTACPLPDFLRGDSSGDGNVDISDAMYSLSYLFISGVAPSCQGAADANDDGSINIADPIAILFHLFSNAGPLPMPFQVCGQDPTPDQLGCDEYKPCN